MRTHKETERMKEYEWWPRRGAHSHYSPTRPARYMCYAWGEGGSAVQAPFLKKKNFFSSSSTSHRRNGKKTRAHQRWRLWQACHVFAFSFSITRVASFWKSFLKKTIWFALFTIFFIFHFRALLTEEMERKHAHINGGGCNKLATWLLFYFPFWERPRSENHFEKYSFGAPFPHFFSFFIFEHFWLKKWKKNTRTSMVAAVTSSPRVCFFIFHYESGLVLKIVFENVFFGRIFPHFFHTSFSSTSHKRNG